MNTVWQIIQERGGLRPGLSVSIDNEPWMRLAIEVLAERGPDGHVVVSVAHYGEQNSDLMRDPEMLFEVVETSDRSASGRSISATIMSAWSNGAGITASRANRSAIQGSLENSKHSLRSGIGTSKSRDFYGHAGRRHCHCPVCG